METLLLNGALIVKLNYFENRIHNLLKTKFHSGLTDLLHYPP